MSRRHRVAAVPVLLVTGLVLALTSCAGGTASWIDQFHDSVRAVELADGRMVAAVAAPGGTTIMRLSPDTGASLWSSYIADANVAQLQIQRDVVLAVGNAGKNGQLLTGLSLSDGAVVSRLRLADATFAGFLKDRLVQFDDHEVAIGEPSGLIGRDQTWDASTGCSITNAVVFGDRVAMLSECDDVGKLTILAPGEEEHETSLAVPASSTHLVVAGDFIIVNREIDFLVLDQSGREVLKGLGAVDSAGAAGDRVVVVVRHDSMSTLMSTTGSAGSSWEADVPTQLGTLFLGDGRAVLARPDPALRWAGLMSVFNLEDGTFQGAFVTLVRPTSGVVEASSIIGVAGDSLARIPVPQLTAAPVDLRADEVLSAVVLNRTVGPNGYVEYVDGALSPEDVFIGRSRVSYVPEVPSEPVISVTVIAGDRDEAARIAEGLPVEWNRGALGSGAVRVGLEAEAETSHQALVEGARGLVLVDVAQCTESEFMAIVHAVKEAMADGG